MIEALFGLKNVNGKYLKLQGFSFNPSENKKYPFLGRKKLFGESGLSADLKKVNNDVNKLVKGEFRLSLKCFKCLIGLRNLKSHDFSCANFNYLPKCTGLGSPYGDCGVHKDLRPIVKIWTTFVLWMDGSCSFIAYPNERYNRMVGNTLTKCTGSELKDSIRSILVAEKPTNYLRVNYKKIKRCIIIPRKRLVIELFETNVNKSSVRSFRNSRCRAHVMRKRLQEAGDVESNPGPANGDTNAKASILVRTYNVRGLNDERKLRHLVNDCHKDNTKNMDAFFMFQETYVDSPGKLPYIWRGNYYLTPGLGNSQGCLTLLSSHVQVLFSKDLGNRGHVLVCQKLGEARPSYIIANIYSPCPNGHEKIAFFENVFHSVDEVAAQYECDQIIIGGDFNLIFNSGEAKNRNYSNQEKNVARIVTTLKENRRMKDVWENFSGYTWRRPNTEVFSTIDRVLISKDTLQIISISTDWSLSASDHASLTVKLEHVNRPTQVRDKLTRLDPTLVKDYETREVIRHELEIMLSSIPEDWNPHVRLEFLKMCIRTIGEKAQADRKKKEKCEEDEVNEELNTAITAIENGEEDVADLIEYVEELRVRKAVLIEKKGERLAERLGSKWYNEGEKSTRYFLRILNRPTPDDFKELKGQNDELISSKNGIEDEIVRYYKKLYEDYEKQDINEDEVQNFLRNIEPINNDASVSVSSRIDRDEMADVLASCKDSAPGPDGIPYSYYRELWAITGPYLVKAWNYTLDSGNLPPSHKESFLKLIPKAGKDLSKLTNWRPITLSNCDHKLITKIYAKRMSTAVQKSINEGQTAYLKGRLINDNVRSMIATINLSNEEEIDGLLVSLDAKKAFDSVEHSYIEKCLEKIGLACFIPIFHILYKDLRSDILINGRIVRGYNILRGVKQGDALSCILFIICMEPLILNIENNQEIEPIISRAVGILPKVYAYADDVNGMIRNTQRSLQALFNEYARLTRVSGLELNADKTEMLHVNRRNVIEPVREKIFNVMYLGKTYEIKTQRIIKVNGIFLQQNVRSLVERNVDQVVTKIDAILRKWSARNFSILGKILIVKTYGISQLTYLMQTMVLTNEHFKRINQLLYKFIWNKHYSASKAPERVKREIVNTKLKLGGYAMLDIERMDRSLKIKSISRIFNSKHPFLKLVDRRIDYDNYFYIRSPCAFEQVSKYGCELLAELRLKKLKEIDNINSLHTIRMLRQTRVSNLLNRLGKLSLAHLRLRTQGKLLVRDLNINDINSIARFVDLELINALKMVQNHRIIDVPEPNRDSLITIAVSNKVYDLRKITSREIRNIDEDQSPICTNKFGAIMAVPEALTWGNCLSKVTSVRHRNTLLKVAHGDVYTKAKLTRFGMANDPNCPRCGEIEDLNHKIVSCIYVRKIWKETLSLTNKLKAEPNGSEADLIENKILGASRDTHPLILTIHSEIINRILSLKDDASYLIMPQHLVKQVLTKIRKLEAKASFKRICDDLLA